MTQPRTTDFLLGTDGDLAIVNGDFAFAADLDGIRQTIQSYLSFFLGEWFLDLSIGVPYFQRIFIKNPSLVEVSEYIRQTLLSVPGVRDVLDLDVRYTGLRIVSIAWHVNTDLGELVGNTPQEAL